MAEREVAHPGAVGRDPVADAHRQHEAADRRRGEDRLRHLLRCGRARGVLELGRAHAAAVGLAAHVGREDRHLDRALAERAGDLDRVAEPLLDRRRQPVVVRAEQRQPPQRVRPERLLRLQAQHEVLEVVEPVERGHGPRQRA